MAHSNSAEGVGASGDRLLPLVPGSGNRAGEHRGRQTHSLVAGSECRSDWWLCVDAQLFTTTGLYVSAVAALAATDGNLVSGCWLVESSMGLRDQLCFILRLVIGSRFFPLCLTCSQILPWEPVPLAAIWLQ